MGLIPFTAVTMFFILAVLYQFKHFLADYILQGEYMLGKFKPGREFVLPLLAHVGVHAGMTLFIAMFVSALADVPVAMRQWCWLIALFDAAVHFVMDRVKASPKLMGRWKPLSGPEWLKAEANRVFHTAGLQYPSNILDVVAWNLAMGEDEFLIERKHPSGKGLEKP